MDEPGVSPQAGASGVAPLADTDAMVYRRRWVILGVLITSLMAIVLDNTVLNVALKTIAEPGAGLGASQSQLEWAINSYTLVFAGLLFTFGVVGDRVGRKRMLMIGLASFGLFSLITAYSHTPDQLVWARAAMGLAAAAVMPQTLSIISNVFDPAERPRAIGIWAVAVGIGIAIGPIVGGLLLAHFWWGSVFLINVPFCAASVAAIALLVPESKNPDPGRIDFVGVLASIAGLVLLVYGIIQGGDKGTWVHPDVLGPALGGLAVLAFFVWYEARIRHPSLDVRLFRDPRLSSAIGALAPRSPALVRRFGAKWVVASGLLLVTIALVSYQVLNVATPIWVLAVAFFIQGAGMGMVMPPATEAVMSVVPRERAGAGSALTNTARQVSGALGVAVLGSILAQAYRSELGPHLSALPVAARNAAASSITASQAVAARLGPAGRELARFADTSFVHAMHLTTLISAAITLLGALIVMRWMPGRAAARTAGPAGAPGAAVQAPAAVPAAVPAAARASAAAAAPAPPARVAVPGGAVASAAEAAESPAGSLAVEG